ncbi:MAG: DNA gyrase modulator, partial [Pseudomonadota bacterium]
MTQTALPFDTARAADILSSAAAGADDGDIFIERTRSESFVFDDGRLKSAAYDTAQGFGLRVVAGEATGNAHSAELTEAAIARAADTAASAKRGYSGTLAEGPQRANRRLYAQIDPTETPDFGAKTSLLAEIDAFFSAPPEGVRV